MRFVPLLLANLGRKKIRTILTMGSFAVALLLYGLLIAIRGAFGSAIEMSGADRLVVMSRVSFIQPLPVAHRDRIAKVPGVTSVTHASWFGGVYQTERNFFAQFAIEADTYPQVYSEFVIPPDQLEAFRSDKAACIVGAATAERYGWEVGDRIPLRGTIFPGQWEFNVRGIYRGTRPQDDLTQFWFRADFLKEKAPSWWDGYVGWYVVRIADPDASLEVSEAIDALFANSAWETRTQTEKALTASFIKQIGNIEFLILTIGGVVFFTLLLVTGNTMAAAVRERLSELAVLKAIGYSDVAVLWLVLSEGFVIAAVGGGLGVIAAKLYTLRGDPTGGFLPSFYIAPEALAAGLGLAFLVALIAGLVPALTAMRLSVIDAKRRV